MAIHRVTGAPRPSGPRAAPPRTLDSRSEEPGFDDLPPECPGVSALTGDGTRGWAGTAILSSSYAPHARIGDRRYRGAWSLAKLHPVAQRIILQPSGSGGPASSPGPPFRASTPFGQVVERLPLGRGRPLSLRAEWDPWWSETVGGWRKGQEDRGGSPTGMLMPRPGPRRPTSARGGRRGSAARAVSRVPSSGSSGRRQAGERIRKAIRRNTVELSPGSRSGRHRDLRPD